MEEKIKLEHSKEKLIQRARINQFAGWIYIMLVSVYVIMIFFVNKDIKMVSEILSLIAISNLIMAFIFFFMSSMERFKYYLIHIK